jgi:hypothetical protein
MIECCRPFPTKLWTPSFPCSATSTQAINHQHAHRDHHLLVSAALLAKPKRSDQATQRKLNAITGNLSELMAT